MKYFLPICLILAFASCKTPEPVTNTKPSPVDNYKMAEKETPVETVTTLPAADTTFYTVPTVNDYSITIKQDSVLMTMSKGYCFGKCPVFTISIGGSGRAVYEGKRNVTKQGIYEKYLDWKEVMNLASRFENAGIFDMADSYPPPAADLPRTTVTFIYGARQKKINGTHNAPPALQDLVMAMNEIAESNGWVKTGEIKEE